MKGRLVKNDNLKLKRVMRKVQIFFTQIKSETVQ